MPFSALEGTLGVYLWHIENILFKRVFVWINMPSEDSFFVCLFMGILYVITIRGPPHPSFQIIYEMEEDNGLHTK